MKMWTERGSVRRKNDVWSVCAREGVKVVRRTGEVGEKKKREDQP